VGRVLSGQNIILTASASSSTGVDAGTCVGDLAIVARDSDSELACCIYEVAKSLEMEKISYSPTIFNKYYSIY
jgi:hypothetical protein